MHFQYILPGYVISGPRERQPSLLLRRGAKIVMIELTNVPCDVNKPGVYTSRNSQNHAQVGRNQPKESWFLYNNFM